MAQQRLGIIMNGVTGRMGMNQHLVRSILAIRAQGGVKLKNGDTVMPDPILVGRNEAKLAQLAKAHAIARWTTDLNAALKSREDTLFFDAATTKLRAKLLRLPIGHPYGRGVTLRDGSRPQHHDVDALIGNAVAA